MTSELILVTGGTGYLGSYCILAALQQGYRVRTTVRSLNRADDVRQMLKFGGVEDEAVKEVQFSEADLTKDDGFDEACKDCKYVLHVASPFPAHVPKDPDELIRPAREGTLRVLKAAKAAGYGYGARTEPFTEKDWSRLDQPTYPVAPYQQSKTIAERAAWDWIAKEGGDLELSVVNPVGIYGPLLGKSYATSVQLVVRLLKGDIPGVPRIGFAVVDVRDCADLHLRAMVDSKAAGERFLASNDEGYLWTREIALKLKEGMAEQGKRVPTRSVPNFVIRLMSFFDAEVGMIVHELGKAKPCSNKKAKEVLGWKPRCSEETLVATGKSLFEHGIVK